MSTQTLNRLHESDLRGHTQIGWLDSYHTFSFGEFRDPERMGFRTLRVINEDRVIPGAGFGTHSHRDMEILTYVLSGALEHKDSLGTGSLILPGEAQIMSAGTGLTHSEFNASQSEPVHFLQIWILPNQASLPPRYEQKAFATAGKLGQWQLIAAKDGRADAVKIFQDVDIYTAQLIAGQPLVYPAQPGRYFWLQVISGIIMLAAETLHAGDGVQLSADNALSLSSDVGGEILLFDLG